MKLVVGWDPLKICYITPVAVIPRFSITDSSESAWIDCGCATGDNPCLCGFECKMSRKVVCVPCQCPYETHQMEGPLCE